MWLNWLAVQMSMKHHCLHFCGYSSSRQYNLFLPGKFDLVLVVVASLPLHANLANRLSMHRGRALLVLSLFEYVLSTRYTYSLIMQAVKYPDCKFLNSQKVLCT